MVWSSPLAPFKRTRSDIPTRRPCSLTARASEEAARLQLARMMDEQLAQNQTIDTRRRQLESSNNSAQQAQALLRANQEQHSRTPPPTTYPSGSEAVIGNTPFIPPLSTPSTGLRTRELHGPGYNHIGSPADQGYAEQMRAMYGRDEMDPPRQDLPSMSSSSRGSSGQYTNPNLGWQNRPGQNVPAFPGSCIVPTRRVDPRDAIYQRMLKFGTAKIPKHGGPSANSAHPSTTAPGSFR